MKKLHIICVGLLFLFVIIQIANPQNGVEISKEVARILLLPYGDAKLVGLARKGERYKIISKKDDWYQIEYKGTIAWVFSSNVAEIAFGEQIKIAQPPAKAEKTYPNSLQTQQQPQKEQITQKPVVTASEVTQPQTKQQEIKKTEIKQTIYPQLTQEKKALSEFEPPPKKQPPKKQSFFVDMPPTPVSPLPENKETKVSSMQEQSKEIKTESQKFQQSAKESQEIINIKPKYFLVTENSSKILAYVSPESPIIAMARKNETYPLIYTGTLWGKIKYQDTSGWIDLRAGKIVDTPSSAKIVSKMVIYAAIIGVCAILLIVLIIFIIIIVKGKSTKRITVKKDLLIIAKQEKEITYSLTDSTTTLSKCFSELGFKVRSTSNIDNIQSMIAHNSPDIIVVDWQINPRIFNIIESYLFENSSLSNIYVIFYNVPQSFISPQNVKIPNVSFLGLSFTDRELFKLITPIMIEGKHAKSIKKSVETSALSGEISHGSLLEVMQFIEIGKKTGCLYIVTEKPFGLIYFENGRLTYAASQSQQGREAVFEILNLKKGHFHFVIGKTSQTKNIDFSTLEILMEWTKTVDETLRA